MTALTDRLMPGCVDIPARRTHILWAAEHIELDISDHGHVLAVADLDLQRAIHNEYAYNITSADTFNGLFLELCRLQWDAQWIDLRNNDTLIDHDVLASHGRDAAYEDARARNDQDILDLLDKLVPSTVGAVTQA